MTIRLATGLAQGYPFANNTAYGLTPEQIAVVVIRRNETSQAIASHFMPRRVVENSFTHSG